MRHLLTGVNWRAFAALLLTGLLGVAAVLPYTMELVGSGIFGQAAAPDADSRVVSLTKNAVMRLAGLQMYQP